MPESSVDETASRIENSKLMLMNSHIINEEVFNEDLKSDMNIQIMVECQSQNNNK